MSAAERVDGGYAFSAEWRSPCRLENPDMTLRDYFAAKAMGALIALEPGGKEIGGMDGVDFVVQAAYAMADAMLAAREPRS